MKKPPDPVYFTDRDLGKQFPHILRSAGLNVEMHGDHFAHNTPDVTWLNEIGQREWVAITHDKSIGRKPNETRAVQLYGVRLIVVIGHAPFKELADNFVATFPKIDRFVRRYQPPYIAKVYRPSPSPNKRSKSGRIEMWNDFS